MKSDKEFIDGIYEKARMLQEQQTYNNQVNKEIVDEDKTWFGKNFNTNKLRTALTIMAMTVVAVVLVPHIITNQGNNIANSNEEYSTYPAAYGVDNQRRLRAEIINGQGMLVDSYINNGDYYYLIKISEGKELDSSSKYIVLYDNGFNHKQLEKVSIGMVISFTYVDDPISLLANVQDALNKKFSQDRLVVYPIDSIQIKE